MQIKIKDLKPNELIASSCSIESTYLFPALNGNKLSAINNNSQSKIFYYLYSNFIVNQIVRRVILFSRKSGKYIFFILLVYTKLTMSRNQYH